MGNMGAISGTGLQTDPECVNIDTLSQLVPGAELGGRGFRLLLFSGIRPPDDPNGPPLY